MPSAQSKILMQNPSGEAHHIHSPWTGCSPYCNNQRHHIIAAHPKDILTGEAVIHVADARLMSASSIGRQSIQGKEGKPLTVAHGDGDGNKSHEVESGGADRAPFGIHAGLLQDRRQVLALELAEDAHAALGMCLMKC